jgi:GNAT superfamily N-acetyltransferase
MPATTVSKTPYRVATEKDALDVVFLTKRFVRESGNMSTLGFDQGKVFDLFLDIVEREDFLVLVKEHEEEIVGMFVAFVVPCFFSEKVQAVELAWYTDKEHRGPRDNLKVIKMYEEWAKERGAVMVNLINLDQLNGEKVGRFYNKNGYKIVENTFVKEI